MACNRCKNKKFAKNAKSQQSLIASTINGFCKIRVKKPGYNNLYDYMCTLKQEFLPHKDSPNYRQVRNTTGSTKFIFWALNKNVERDLDSQAGWVTIEAKEIVFFESISSTP